MVYSRDNSVSIESSSLSESRVQDRDYQSICNTLYNVVKRFDISEHEMIRHASKRFDVKYFDDLEYSIDIEDMPIYTTIVKTRDYVRNTLSREVVREFPSLYRYLNIYIGSFQYVVNSLDNQVDRLSNSTQSAVDTLRDISCGLSSIYLYRISNIIELIKSYNSTRYATKFLDAHSSMVRLYNEYNIFSIIPNVMNKNEPNSNYDVGRYLKVFNLYINLMPYIEISTFLSHFSLLDMNNIFLNKKGYIRDFEYMCSLSSSNSRYEIEHLVSHFRSNRKYNTLPNSIPSLSKDADILNYVAEDIPTSFTSIFCDSSSTSIYTSTDCHSNSTYEDCDEVNDDISMKTRLDSSGMDNLNDRLSTRIKHSSSVSINISDCSEPSMVYSTTCIVNTRNYRDASVNTDTTMSSILLNYFVCLKSRSMSNINLSGILYCVGVKMYPIFQSITTIMIILSVVTVPVFFLFSKHIAILWHEIFYPYIL